MSNGEKRGHDTAWDPLHNMNVSVCSIHCTFTGRPEKTSQIDCVSLNTGPNNPNTKKPAAFCVWSTHNRQPFTKLSLPNVAFSGKRPWEPKTTAGDLSSVKFHPIFCFLWKENQSPKITSIIDSFPCLSQDLHRFAIKVSILTTCSRAEGRADRCKDLPFGWLLLMKDFLLGNVWKLGE